MIRARMLHGSISNSARVAALSCDGARLLFTWLIPHCDNLGRLRAEPIQLKATVMPRHACTLAQLKRWTEELHAAGLVQLYEVQAQRFLAVKNWSVYQKLQVNHSRSSVLPEPPYDVYTPSIRPQENVSHEGEGEGEENLTLAPQRLGNGHATDATPTPTQWFLESFWPRYPRPKARGRALKAFLAIAKATPQAEHDRLAGAILGALERDIADEWADRPMKAIPYPATWLNDKSWEE